MLLPNQATHLPIPLVPDYRHRIFQSNNNPTDRPTRVATLLLSRATMHVACKQTHRCFPPPAARPRHVIEAGGMSVATRAPTILSGHRSLTFTRREMRVIMKTSFSYRCQQRNETNSTFLSLAIDHPSRSQLKLSLDR